MYIDVSHVLFLVAVWGPIGPLFGIWIGHRLLKSWQREQWLVDARKEEFKELLTTLTMAYSLIAKSRIPMMVYSPEDQIALADAEASALRTIRDRIYIADVVTRLDTLNQWIALTKHFDDNRDYSAFRKSYNVINEAIVKAAVDDLYPTQKRWWDRSSK